MVEDRIFNFNAGPATLPLPVLEEIKDSFLNYKGCGMSVTEISHRSELFDEIINDAVARTRRLLKLGDEFHVLFIQGGASAQFAFLPMNFLSKHNFADYVNTGTWSTKAMKEAEIQGKNIKVVASSEDGDFSYIPSNIQFNADATFAHITSNNTIKGTQWDSFPDTGGVPIVADMSSDFMSRPIAMEKFGMIYAGAQKNIGPAGACMVIIRDDMLNLVQKNLPSMMSYTSYASKNSMYNTPPCFTIYTIQLVMKWLEETIGGLDEMALLNSKKAERLYTVLDTGDFYKPIARKDSRSMMNVTFRLPDPELDKMFVEEALQNGIGGLKGHVSVGGCRASIYNAATMEGIEALVGFMKTFEKERG